MGAVFSAFGGAVVGAAAALGAGAADCGTGVSEDPQAKSASNNNASGMTITVRGFLKNRYDIGCPSLFIVSFGFITAFGNNHM